uniref:(northern house mosquito) hypothetical protein n=1 Tax=Culex pipiens TaxID=7175 RepID=A0A8D8HJF5_CULPI
MFPQVCGFAGIEPATSTGPAVPALTDSLRPDDRTDRQQHQLWSVSRSTTSKYWAAPRTAISHLAVGRTGGHHALRSRTDCRRPFTSKKWFPRIAENQPCQRTQRAFPYQEALRTRTPRAKRVPEEEAPSERRARASSFLCKLGQRDEALEPMSG